MTNELTKRIMKRVYAIWFLKKIAPAIFLYIPFLFFVALRETANEFFVAEIVNNFLVAVHNGFVATMNYLLSAATNTPVLPTLIILASLGVLVFLLHRIARSFKTVRLARSSM